MSNLEIKIMSDLKDAMKSKNQAALRGIRAIKAALLLSKTDGSGKELNEADEIKMIQKLVKQRQDSLDIFKTQGREDLAVIEEEEIQILQNYLPEQLNEDQIIKIVEQIIQDTQAEGMKDMGKVMGIASKKVAGKADGKTLADLIKKLLN